MNHRRLIALNVSALLFALPFVGCGSYEDDEPGSPTTTGSTTTTGNTTNTVATTGGTDTSSTATATTSGTTGGTTTGAATTGNGAGGATGTATATSTTGALDASCENVAACGGDVVGTWSVGGSCLSVSGMADLTAIGVGCTSAPVEGMLQVSGMLTFNADGTFTDTTTTTGDITFRLPAECLEVSGVTTTCDRMAGTLQSTLGLASVMCMEDSGTGGCDCAGTVNQAGGMASVRPNAPEDGEYTSADNVITLEEEAEYTYCIEENILTMSLQSTPTPGPVTGSIAFQKQ